MVLIAGYEGVNWFKSFKKIRLFEIASAVGLSEGFSARSHKARSL